MKLRTDSRSNQEWLHEKEKKVTVRREFFVGLGCQKPDTGVSPSMCWVSIQGFIIRADENIVCVSCTNLHTTGNYSCHILVYLLFM